MNKIYLLAVVVLCVYIFLHSQWFYRLRRFWRDQTFGSWNRKLTMFDVRQLLIKGEKDMAVRVYCELFKTNVLDATKAVEEIERSIQPKDFEL